MVDICSKIKIAVRFNIYKLADFSGDGDIFAPYMRLVVPSYASGWIQSNQINSTNG